MKWAWRIGTFSGVAVYIHATFLLLLGGAFWLYYQAGQSLGSALVGVLFILLLFLCVVLHEFGHALAAQRYGIKTRDITLYPIGGVARLERIPRNPRQELVIAVAGPLVNVVIATALGVGVWLRGQWAGVPVWELARGGILGQLLQMNVILVLFNLIPAFPMDGGRVLRAFLAERMEYGRATQIAAGVGQALAFVFGFIGLVKPELFMLLFIALFVYIGAGEEASTVQAELAFRGVPVARAMMTAFVTLAPEDPLSLAGERLLAGAQTDFPVLRDGQVVGILTRQALVEGLGQLGPGAPVEAALSPAPTPVPAGASLEEVFQQMRAEEARTVPVVEDGRLVGLVTLENIGELLMLRTALQERKRTSRPGSGPDPAREPDARRV